MSYPHVHDSETVSRVRENVFHEIVIRRDDKTNTRCDDLYNYVQTDQLCEELVAARNAGSALLVATSFVA